MSSRLSPAASSSSSEKNWIDSTPSRRFDQNVVEVGRAGEAPGHADDRDPTVEILVLSCHRSLPSLPARQRPELLWGPPSPDQRAGSDVTVRLVPGSPVIDEYPLTPVQQGMLFHRLEGTNVGVDIEQFVGELAEDVDVDAMRAAWQRVADRHPIMRTRFRWTDRDEPVQEVVEHVDVALAVHDLRALDAREQDEALAAFLVADRRAGFELDAAPLWHLTPAPDHRSR